MPPLQVARSANIAFQRSYLPIALFIGATSGIGQATAEAFARATKGNAHIIICGRNRIAGEATIAQFPKPTSSDAIHEFIECDVSLMKNVQHITDSLISRLPKLNYLLVSQGIFTMRGSDRTSEDMERKLALHYYSRWKFIHDLAPLLKKATDSGEDAKAISVYAPGLGGKVIWDDLGLKNNFSAATAGLVAPAYNDMMIESFAEQYPGVSFIHATPGAVRTNLLRPTSLAGHLLKNIVAGLVYPFSLSPEESGEYMLWSLLHSKSGAVRSNSHGDEITGLEKWGGSEEDRRRLWEHTEAEIQRALEMSASSE